MSPSMFLYRSAQSYFANESVVTFHTEPFLCEVGCGISSNMDALIEAVLGARHRGYRIIIVKSRLLQSSLYPISSRDGEFIENAIAGSA